MSEVQPVAFIPARAGSKRLPRKNIVDLGNRPLVAWTIEAARESGIFGDRVWVSSESAEVLEVAKRWGAQPHRRPDELAGDRIPMQDAARSFATRWSGQEREETALYVMLPTCPFRSARSIRSAWERFSSGLPEATALISVVELDHPPQWSLRRQGNRLVPMDPKEFDTVRQTLEPAYRHDGGHMITTVSTFLERGSVIGQEPLFFPTPAGEEVDINTPLELEWAEFLLERGALERREGA